MRRFIKKSPFLAAILLLGCSLSLPEKHFQLAEQYAAQGQPNRAIEEYKKVVAADDKNTLAPKALLKMGTIYREQLKNYHEAIATFRKVYKKTEDQSDKIISLKTIAQIYRDDLDNPRAAVEEMALLYKEFGVAFKGGDSILLEYAHALKDAGKHGESANRYTEFLEKFPGHKEGPRVMLYEANEQLSAANFEAAEKNFLKIIEQFSGREDFKSLVAEAQYGLGSLFEEKDEVARAQEYYQLAREAYPNPEVMTLKLQGIERRKKERQTQ
jgi:tetratricopeptide (TPR) repeat protein